ncbi:MAG: EAL domain-containing protein [Acidaminococcaceae bacterium]
MKQNTKHFNPSYSVTRRYDKALRSIYNELFEINFTDDICRLLNYTGSKNNLFCNDEETFSALLRKTAEQTIHPADKARFLEFFDLAKIRTILSSGTKYASDEFRKAHSDNKYHNFTITLIPLEHETEKEHFLCCLAERENTVQTESHAENKKENCYDELTGLSSKAVFYKKVHALLTAKYEQHYCIAIFDIDKFKLVNDFFGTHAGDRLLCYIAKLLEEYFAKNDDAVYCRLESDRFAACFLFSGKAYAELIDYITTGLQKSPLNFELAAYFGLYLPETPDLPVNIMCDRAMLAQKSIKGRFDKNYAFYEEELRKKLLHKQEITGRMNQALKGNQFEIYLQPKVHLITNEIVGAESLVRWNHPTLGLLSPGDFITIFEENGFITNLDIFVWEETCRLLRKWLDEGRNTFPISVNVSRLDLLEPSFFQTITNLVEKYEIDPKMLNLELTETAYVKRYDEIKLVTDKLRDYGFSVHMDDFGSGYSALNMLQDIAVDTLKIDLNFMSGFAESGRGRNILSSVIRMAKWLGLPVVIEGVENEEQVAFLRSIGCTVGQGYYFSKPLPVDKFEKSLKENEQKAKPLKRIESTCYPNSIVNIEDFWSPTSAFNLLFNTLQEASAIYEYHDKNLELLRANDSYYDLLGIQRENLYFAGTHLLDYIHAEDREKFVMNLPIDESTSPVKHTFRRLVSEDRMICLHSQVHFLAGDAERKLYYTSISKIELVSD